MLKPSRSFLSRPQAQSLLLLIIITGVCLSGRYVLLPEKELSIRTLTDDAYYYFQTARNVARGNGSTSTGGIEHNGYHPLWLVTSSIIFRLTPQSLGDMLPIRLILTFGMFCSAMAAIVAYRILRRLKCSRGVALIGAGVFHLNPFMILLTVGGLEAPLHALLLSGLFLAYLRLREKPDASFASHLGFGVLMGLVYLVRTDNIFLIAMLWGHLTFERRKANGGIMKMIACGFLAFFIVLPWVAWNAVHFGGLVQGSASALPVVRYRAFLAANPEVGTMGVLGWRLALIASWIPSIFWSSGLGLLWHAMAAFCVALLGIEVIKKRQNGKPFNPLASLLRWGLLILVICAFALGRNLSHMEFRDWLLMGILVVLWGLFWELLARGRTQESQSLHSRLRHLVPLFIAVMLLGIIHKGFRFATREWYFVPSDLMLALGWAILTQWIFDRANAMLPMLNPRRLTATLLILMSVVLGAWFARKVQANWQKPLNPYTWELMEYVNGLAPKLEPGERVGATDSGLIGYHATVPVVNLDGVVNPDASQANVESRLLDYCRSEELQYLLITPRMAVPEILGAENMQYLERFEPLGPEGYILHEK